MADAKGTFPCQHRDKHFYPNLTILAVRCDGVEECFKNATESVSADERNCGETNFLFGLAAVAGLVGWSLVSWGGYTIIQKYRGNNLEEQVAFDPAKIAIQFSNILEFFKKKNNDLNETIFTIHESFLNLAILNFRNEGWRYFKDVSQKLIDEGVDHLHGKLALMEWMRNTLDDDCSIAILDAYNGTLMDKILPDCVKDFLFGRSSSAVMMAKIIAKVIWGLVVAVYSQVDLVFDSYLFYLLIADDSYGQNNPTSLRVLLLVFMGLFIALPVLFQITEKIILLPQYSWQKQILFICLLPFSPLAIISYNFIQRIRRVLLQFRIQIMAIKMFNYEKDGGAELLAEGYGKGFNKMKREKVEIEREVAHVKLKESIMEGQPESVMKIALVLLFFSETKVLTGVEAEFGKTTSLIPGVENYVLIIVSIISSILLNAISFWSVMSETRSKTVPFFGKLLLRKLTA